MPLQALDRHLLGPEIGRERPGLEGLRRFAWSAVHIDKWSSWSLLVIMTFTIVANLKHFKERIHVPA